MNSRLKVLCVLIVLTALAMVSFLFVELWSRKAESLKVKGNRNTVVVEPSSTVKVEVEGDDNLVIVQKVVDTKALMKERAFHHANFLSDKSAESLSYTIEYWARYYDIPLVWAYSLVETESDFVLYPGVNRLGYVGNTQIGDDVVTEFNWATGRNVTLEDVNTSYWTNIEVGFWYYQKLLRVYGGNFGIYSWKDAYIAYNCGPGVYAKNPYYYKYEAKYNERSRNRFYEISNWWLTKLI